jgi:hypothetical protein
MMNQPIHWHDVIERGLIAEATRLAAAPGGPIRTAFVTGSYARGTHDAFRPNVNVYFISEPGRGAEGRWAAGRSFHALRDQLRAGGVELVVDCHPFTLSFRDPAFAELPTLTVTTKVLDAAARERRYDLPPTIGAGWVRRLRRLHGPEDDLAPLRTSAQRNDDWLQAYHEALVRYRGVLDHLPWAFDWRACPFLLLDESLRYAEEAIRDAVAIVQTDEEVERDVFLDVLFAWRERAEPYFRERFGAPGLRALKDVAALKERARRGPPADEAEALAAWECALRVWQVVWDRYVAVAEKLQPGGGWRQRANAFM